MHYLDTSAATKLVVAEQESRSLTSWIGEEDRHLATSDLTRTELLRAVKRYAPEHLGTARAVLESIDVISLSRSHYDTAGRIEPPELRSLDALHLAVVLDLGDDLDAVITYDTRMVEAARINGIPVVAPSA